MAFVFRKGYGSSTEQRRDAFFQTLSEKDRRRYAAMEAMKLGHGGMAYMARVLGCSRRTICFASSSPIPRGIRCGRMSTGPICASLKSQTSWPPWELRCALPPWWLTTRRIVPNSTLSSVASSHTSPGHARAFSLILWTRWSTSCERPQPRPDSPRPFES